MSFLAGTAQVLVVPNATGFSALLQKQIAPAQARLETGFKAVSTRLIGQATGLGTSIGTGIAVGLGVAAFAAGKMALDFEKAFTRIRTLSNASAADIERWKDQVLSLSGETARAPAELTEALFFLASAGLDTGQVMEALSVSAKAAAVGLGSTVDVANITASALNAYADAALTAADVTDTLVAAVKAGRAEPEEFANSLGRLLPIAVQAGVSFQDLTASLSSLSNVGLDVEEAATAMRGALQAIAAPGPLAAAALDQLGLSAQNLLDAISEHGLFGALQLLDQAARDNTDTQAEYIGVLRKVVPNVRALTGVLGLTGQEAEKVNALFEQVSDSTGSLSEAFDQWLKGPGASFAKLFNNLKIAAIKFGEAILPIGRTIAQVLAPVLKFAADNAKILLGVLIGYAALKFLPGLLLGVAVQVEALGAASLASGTLSVAAGVETLGARLAAMAGPAALAASAIVGVGLALAHLTGHGNRTFADEGVVALASLIVREGELAQTQEALATSSTTLNTRLTASVRALQDMGGGAVLGGEALGRLGVLIDRAAVGMDRFTQLTGVDATAVFTTFRQAVQDAAGNLGKLQAASAAAVRQAKAIWDDWHDTIVQAFGGAGSALDQFADKANVDLSRATNRLNAYTRQITVFGRNIGSISDTFGRKANAFIQWATEQGLAQSGLVASVANANRENARSFVEAFNTGENATGSLATQIQQTLGRAFDAMLVKLSAIKRALLGQPPLDVDTRRANAALDALQARLIALTSRSWSIVVGGRGPVFAAAGFHGQVTQPTMFVAGEAGAERVDIGPGGVRTGSTAGGSGQIRGQLQMVDWNRGLVDLQAELDHAEFVGAH